MLPFLSSEHCCECGEVTCHQHGEDTSHQHGEDTHYQWDDDTKHQFATNVVLPQLLIPLLCVTILHLL